MNRIRANDASTLVDDKVGQRHKHTDRQTGRRTVTWELIGKNWGETLYKGATNRVTNTTRDARTLNTGQEIHGELGLRITASIRL